MLGFVSRCPRGLYLFFFDGVVEFSVCNALTGMIGEYLNNIFFSLKTRNILDMKLVYESNSPRPICHVLEKQVETPTLSNHIEVSSFQLNFVFIKKHHLQFESKRHHGMNHMIGVWRKLAHIMLPSITLITTQRLKASMI